MKRTNKIISAIILLTISLPLMASCLMPTGTPSDGAGSDLNDRELVTVLNDNEPYFDAEDYAYAQGKGNFVEFSEFDDLGRVGPAWGLLDYSMMPEPGSRDFDLDYDPTGWVQNRYPSDIVSSGWLYERSHLIAWSLASVASEPKALMTGTAMFNDPGMTQFEEMVADHMRDYRDHDVLYRVTPDFYQDNLVAYGATMEADCLDCDLEFCAYIANINPGVIIDYATGENWEAGTDTDAEDPSTLPGAQDYVVNRSNGKFHLPTCRYAESMSASNREEMRAPRSWMMANGYDPCGVCNP